MNTENGELMHVDMKEAREGLSSCGDIWLASDDATLQWANGAESITFETPEVIIEKDGKITFENEEGGQVSIDAEWVKQVNERLESEGNVFENCYIQVETKPIIIKEKKENNMSADFIGGVSITILTAILLAMIWKCFIVDMIICPWKQLRRKVDGLMKYFGLGLCCEPEKHYVKKVKKAKGKVEVELKEDDAQEELPINDK